MNDNPLVAAVAGDVDAYAALQLLSHDALQELERRHPRLVVTTDAVRRVDDAWERGHVTGEVVQAWASLMRRGYAPQSGVLPIRPIQTDYDPANDDVIVEALGRLDEIGDLIDGNATPAEIRSLLGQGN